MAVENETAEQRLCRAYGYPYARPASSFLYMGDQAVYTFSNTQWQGVESMARMEVCALDGGDALRCGDW